MSGFSKSIKLCKIHSCTTLTSRILIYCTVRTQYPKNPIFGPKIRADYLGLYSLFREFSKRFKLYVLNYVLQKCHLIFRTSPSALYRDHVERHALPICLFWPYKPCCKGLGYISWEQMLTPRTIVCIFPCIQLNCFLPKQNHSKQNNFDTVALFFILMTDLDSTPQITSIYTKICHLYSHL